MRPITEFSKDTIAQITTALADIDDTLTTDRRLPVVAYKALEGLFNARFHIASITHQKSGEGFVEQAERLLQSR